ncbi:MAG: class I adenylate-forming enzyme family protein, partial [Alphaproteobacteria bacterium]|nr:class I adenylate-forming enzyme family protein [Alphaproteobacteria bacterium]
MILSSRAEIEAYGTEGIWGTATLDSLFFRRAHKNPKDVILIDYEETSCAGAPLVLRKVTYEQANRFVNNVAWRLLQCGLVSDDVVILQLPNSIESYLSILAVLRIQSVACLVPSLWRERELISALKMVRARAIITKSRFEGHEHADMMRHVAAKTINIRHLFAFGLDVLDGVENLDTAWDNVSSFDLPPHRLDQANHVATLSWDFRQNTGLRPVARSHNQWIAAGMMHLLTSGLSENDIMLSPYQPIGVLALGMVMVPWLLSGCVLALKQAFGKENFLTILRETEASYTLLPPVFLERLAEKGKLIRGATKLQQAACVWSSPVLAEKLGGTSLPSLSIDIIDIVLLGEGGAWAARRELTGISAYLPLGKVRKPENITGAPVLLETRVSEKLSENLLSETWKGGELDLRGPMCPSLLPELKNRMETAKNHDDDSFFRTGIMVEIIEEDRP